MSEDEEHRRQSIAGVIAVVVILMGIYRIFIYEDKKSEPYLTTDQKYTQQEPAKEIIQLPQEEKTFISIVSSAQGESRSAANDMARGGVKFSRDKKICDLFSNKLAINNWVGTISTLSANSDGKGVLEIDIANGVQVKTWNNALSDFRDNTLLDPRSNIFKTASSLSVGEVIKFSGSFIGGDSGDCIRESSMTLQGKLSSPEFIFKFSDISPSTPTNNSISKNSQSCTAIALFDVQQTDGFGKKILSCFRVKNVMGGDEGEMCPVTLKRGDKFYPSSTYSDEDFCTPIRNNVERCYPKRAFTLNGECADTDLRQFRE